MATTPRQRLTVISGGTDGMGRALALARLDRGDRVVAIGSNPAKGRALLEAARSSGAADRLEYLRADLSSVTEVRRVIDELDDTHQAVDALALFANRPAPKRTTTTDGLEATFALYYLSRYLLSHGLRDLLDRAPTPVIVNIAGVGTTKGAVHWDDMQLTERYGMVGAQLQAGRANDLLGVDFADNSGSRARYVLYHPGFTKSGDLGTVPLLLRVAIRTLARIAARPIAASVAPIVDWVDTPPSPALTAVDRGRILPRSLPTLDPDNAVRLAEATAKLLESLPSQ